MSEIMVQDPPSTWKRYRLGQLFVERKTKVSDKDYPPLSVTMQGILPQLETAAKSDDGDNRKLVLKGDYVINSRSDRRGSGGISKLDGSVSLISIVLEPNGVVPEFAHHLLRSPAFQEEFYRWGHGIVADLWTTRYADMKNIRLALPDLATQKAIADFLDRETARIDQLIEKKHRLVEVLREQVVAERETAIWSDGAMSKLGYHISILPGYAFPSSGFTDDPEDIRLLRGANVGVDILRWDDIVCWPACEAQGLHRFQLFEGDIVMGMDRPWISSGIRVAKVQAQDIPCLLLQRVCKITPLPTLNDMFLKALLESRRFLAHFEPILTGVSVPHISGDQIASFRFPHISVDEQTRRVAKFGEITTKIGVLRSKIDISIDRLREYRAALITAAVTGQIDLATHHRHGASDRALDRIEEEMQT